LLTVGLIGAALWLPPGAAAAAGDIGFEGPSSTNAGASPTGSKPESKLWFNDGVWWASMWHVGSGDFHIFRLNTGTQTWSDTGVALDDRSGTRADVLWDGAAGKLYVASHRFNDKPSTGNPSRLYRFSYNASTNTYTRDSGFPVTINNYRLETLVIDKDTTGQLWATWVQGGKVWINSTVCSPTCNDATWGTAFSLAVPTVAADDISSVIAFGGDRIGVMWSNQNTDTDYFAVHRDADADGDWAVETALTGTNMADDHINLKTTLDGRVFAAVKTSRTASTDPLTMLLVRSAAGTWSSHQFGTVGNGHTRPIVVLDEQHGVVHMFATSAGSGGSIMEKTSPINAISFAAGKGTEVIRDDSTLDVNDATSTKENVSSATGLVVAAHSSSRNYFHHFDSLNGGSPSPPVASFTAAPTTGTAPLTVQFTDTSSGTIVAWAWDFQDDGIVDATVPNPSFTYLTPGTYTARLTVANTAGSDDATRTITVTQSGGGGGTLTFTPADDAYVRSAYPSQTSGADTTLRVFVSGTSDTQSYLRFVVGGVAGAVTDARLRLFVVDGSAVSGSVYAVPSSAWDESTITWQTKPAPGALLAGPQAATLGTWVEFDLTGAVTADGTYSFVVKDGSTNTAWYSSKEGTDDPQLVLTVAP
jgi:PKD repeat protein